VRASTGVSAHDFDGADNLDNTTPGRDCARVARDHGRTQNATTQSANDAVEENAECDKPCQQQRSAADNKKKV
jgi:hypothetical protein